MKTKEEKKTEEKKKKTEDDDVNEKTDKKIEGEALIPLEDYMKYGCHLGTKVITPHMRPFVYRRRADGIGVLNTNLIDEKLKEATKWLSNYKPEDIIIVCKREVGWNAVNLFSTLTGIKSFTKKYPAGILTNTTLPNFFEVEVVIICDPWLDKNALNDAKKINKKVLALCDTNNFTFGVDVLIPCNNKSNKSLGLILYLLAREYLRLRGIKLKVPPLEQFVGEEKTQKEQE